MLLFKPEHVLPILAGRKVHTRRQWKKCRVRIGSIQKCKLKMLSRDFFASVLILNTYEEPLGYMTEYDAHKEGYNSLKEYQEEYVKIYGSWDPSRVVWVVVFELATGTFIPPSPCNCGTRRF